MPYHRICPVFCIQLCNFFFTVYVLLIVNFHAATGTAHGTIASAVKGFCNDFFSFFVVSFIKILFIDFLSYYLYYIPI